MLKQIFTIAPLVLALSACTEQATSQETQANQTATSSAQQTSEYTVVKGAEDRFGIYTDYTLTSDISHLTANQKDMLGLLIEAAKIMDDLFWQQAFAHDKRSFLNAVPSQAQSFADINYGPGIDSMVINPSYVSSVRSHLEQTFTLRI